MQVMGEVLYRTDVCLTERLTASRNVWFNVNDVVNIAEEDSGLLTGRSGLRDACMGRKLYVNLETAADGTCERSMVTVTQKRILVAAPVTPSQAAMAETIKCVDDLRENSRRPAVRPYDIWSIKL